MWDVGGHMSWWGWTLMSVGSLLLWTLIGIGAVALISHRGSRAVSIAEPTAEELVAQRFARGEIDATEYHQRLAVLRGRPSAPTYSIHPGRTQS